MILYLQEIKQNAKSLIIWTVCVVGLYTFAMSMFPSFAQNPEMINEMMKMFPQEMLDAFGIAAADFSKPLDYMSYMFQYILLAVGAQAILLGSSIVAKEEADRTIEFLYAKPVTRSYILTSKISAGITIMAVLNVVFLGAALAVLNIISNDVDNGIVALLCLSMLLIQLLFFAIGLIISMLAKKGRRFTSLSLGILFATFFLGIMSGVAASLKDLRYISPLKYFDPSKVVHSGSLESVYLVIVLVAVAASVAGAYILYKKRDLAA